MTRTQLRVLLGLFVAALISATLVTLADSAQDSSVRHWHPDIAEIRRVAQLIPGQRAQRINLLKFAESHRTKNISVEGAPAEPSVQARTVFQVVYPNGTVMIDSGMDEAVHKLLGRGAVEPYFPDRAAEMYGALRRARLIVLTHEHGDHAAGVIEPPLGPELAPKTILTRTQRDALVSNPQFPQIGLTAEAASRYLVIDYDSIYPLAPGMVLIKAPGHTPGSQMIYVALESGKEFLFSGDAAWHLDNIRLLKGKNAPWVNEDRSAIMDQLVWLHDLLSGEKNLTIVVSHDDEQQRDLVARHLMGGKLE